MADEYHDQPPTSSVCLDTDLVPKKYSVDYEAVRKELMEKSGQCWVRWASASAKNSSKISNLEAVFQANVKEVV